MKVICIDGPKKGVYHKDIITSLLYFRIPLLNKAHLYQHIESNKNGGIFKYIGKVAYVDLISCAMPLN